MGSYSPAAPINHEQGSTVTNNTLDGIVYTGAATEKNSVKSTLIGVTAGGAAAGNGLYGVRFSGGAHNNDLTCLLTGSDETICDPSGQTVISANGLGGVRLESGAALNAVDGNYIGLTPSGATALPNHGPGIDVDNSPDNQFGTQAPNAISSNLGPGVRIANSNGNFVDLLNTIGGTGLGNAGPGVELINATNTSVQPILVSGNTGAGIAVRAPAQPAT